jgi:citrate lyase subunit beta / citryl-CoA lyase
MSTRSRDLSRRSCLSVPGSSDRMIAKAAGLAVDVVMIDLEDSVAPTEKADARSRAAHAVRDVDWGDRIVAVRVNAWDTPWTHADVIEVAGAAGPSLDELILPKAQSPEEVVAIDLLLTQVEQLAGLPRGQVGIEVQIETARGLTQVDRICAASSRLEAVVLGPVDMSASLELPGALDGSRLPDDVRTRVLTGGRAAGLQVIDGPYTHVRDVDGFKAHCLRAHDLGYDGTWVLHPDQVDVANEIYSPDQAAFDRAWDMLDAYAAATTGDRRGAVMFGDEMIDEASRKVGLKVVARGERAGLVRTDKGA